MAAITSTGLGSGLDINGMVTKLVAAERSPSDTRFTKREASDNAKITAFGNFKSALSDFKGSFSALSQSSSFQKISAESTDSTVIKASALSVADIGSYQMEVKSLAQNHVVASAGYADPSSVVGTGTLTINFGTAAYDATTNQYTDFTQNPSKSSLTLTIDSSNNTLTGIRDTINKSNAGVSASILNDGTGNRLILKSTDSGVKNSMQIKVSDAGTSGLSDLAFDSSSSKMTQTQVAKDALVNINGIDVSSPNNTVSSALKGVTLNLLQAQVGKPVTVNISRNDADLNTAVNSFVDKYNALVTTVKSATNYDTKTNTAGILLGDSVVQSGMSQIRNTLTSVATNKGSSIHSLADVGISIQKDGTLKFDAAKFASAKTSDLSGVTALFSVMGRTEDSNVQYIGSTTSTKTGNYAVNITQAATQGSLEGSSISFPLTIDTSNNGFAIKVDGGLSGHIALTQKTYANGSDLATDIQSSINADSILKGNNLNVNVSYDSSNNRLVIRSNTYGADSQVEITEGISPLGLNVGAGIVGVDVAGTINGQSAVGSGQFLTSTAGESSGLKLIVDRLTIGDRGSINFGRGLIDQLSTKLDNLLSNNGTINARTSGLQTDLGLITKGRALLDTRMVEYQARMLKQFNAMDAFMASMQATSTYLTQQLAVNNKSTN